MKPVLKYRGGKQREIHKFIKEVPPRFDRYFEPFLGGGSVFFHLEPEQAVIGDVNSKLITFYTQLRDQYPAMREQLAALQKEYDANQVAYESLKKLHPTERCPNKNEELYYRVREEFNHPTGAYLDGVLYYFINSIFNFSIYAVSIPTVVIHHSIVKSEKISTTKRNWRSYN